MVQIYPFRGMLRVWSGFPGACSIRTCVLVPPPASCGEERRMCAFPLNCHTTSGSFQRDSAGAGHSCHRFRLHDRRASCPFSGAVRRSRLPGIVSFHRHSPPEGCGPSCPEMWSGVRPAAYCTQRGWRQMHRRHPLCVKGEKGAERKWEREGIRPHTPIFA